MGKSLVIVESPAKAKTINKYLGEDYVVKSSVGHIRDLPTSSKGKTASKPGVTKNMTPEEKAAYKKQKEKAALVARMGVDPEHNWQAEYEILPGKEKVVAELQKLAEKADTVYLATDLDREGEAIAWHLREVIGGEDTKYKRVVFNEITKKAIQAAFSTPDDLNIDRVNAQQARRFLDRVVGFMVSPLLWKKIARGLSAGRVQSVAVRLVVDREHDIKAFVPEEYWEVKADTQTSDATALKLDVNKHLGKTFRPTNKTETDKALAEMKQADFVVSDCETRPTSSKASAPFITSTLQQSASTRLGFGVKKTMMLAQRLYEAGHITYMRTDSTNLSAEAVDACRQYIESELGEKYLPDAPVKYGSKDNAQEAHEAIRPSVVTVTADSLDGVEAEAKRLYDLIWRQFVACQMTPAKYKASTITVKVNDYELRAKGRVLVFDGWTRIQPPAGKKGQEDQLLPEVSVGDQLNLIKLDPKQNFTKPPARYSEAALVKELEKRGIGRPSTYAAIISTIQDRGYVRLENKRFYAEKMGEIVTGRLLDNFNDLMSFDFTANMEKHLDDIANGDLRWHAVLDQFYDGFKKKLELAEKDPDEGGMKPNQPIPVDIDCPECSRHMTIRTASTGVFLGCSGYALPPKERCTKTMNLTSGEEAVDANDEEAETNALRAKRRCQKCGTAMDSYLIDTERKLHVCGNNPSCDGYEIEKGQFKIKGYDGPVIECDKCGAEMQLKNGRFGKYFGCTAEECKNTRKLLRNGQPAPPKEDPIPLPELECEKSDAYFVLRDGASGIFLAAHNFPKSRETRAPKVSELKRFKDRLHDKFKYLADAPEKDPHGNPAIIKFSRKNKEQYVASEMDGKASGWIAHYIDGKWVEDASKLKKAK
ncbi:type I DNA topoisomerase [Catenovulum sediminis]|uniref:type I DNA topoisomerase n=1 Tax=Catenovulum sediminis TaxID=1740262 RepID=UPI00117F0F3F|nr:type I DNA topoisomerase [Catenovulum sediminis]